MAPELRLPFDEPGDRLVRRDDAARRFAVDPRRNVVLDASAGTGKTTVLVTRYLNLLRAGVDPANILAMTFTRKAAAEMRQRIVSELRRSAMLSDADAARWHDLRDRLGDISICTIDAFCLSLLREFPLEAGLDPGFDVADETLAEAAKVRALDRALDVCRRMAARDEDMRLLMASLNEGRLRRGLGRLLDRRLVARPILRRQAESGRRASVERACLRFAERLRAAFGTLPGGIDRFLLQGPRFHPAFALAAADLRRLVDVGVTHDGAQFRAALDGIRGYFLTKQGDPRKRVSQRYRRDLFASAEDFRCHARAVADIAPVFAAESAAFGDDLNQVLARGVRRAFEVAAWQLRRHLEDDSVLDFPELLSRTLALLERMDEFSRSRYRLEARYHHVLVDEFQDTSRAQWRLVSLLVSSWGEGAGLASEDVLPPSIFVVGDRKQSIYGFRDADLTMIGRARREIEALRPGGRVRRSISRSFRSAPALLAFTNDLFAAITPGSGSDAFRFRERDQFPVEIDAALNAHSDCRLEASAWTLGLVSADTLGGCAEGVASEICRLLEERTTVRDPRTGIRRPVTPGDIAILFRSREGHQEYERALATREIRSYVYKGLGFFDADETKDLLALVDYLATPDSDLCAAAVLRSRFVRLSDEGVRRLAPHLAAALRSTDVMVALEAEDRLVLDRARRSVASWLPLVERLAPAEIIERVLAESAYAWEIRGSRYAQSRENLKKMRALVRRIQNRGYATMGDISARLRTLSAGDESNAVVDAIDAVNLMTIHAAKGLEFPIVFLVNLARGTGGGRDSIRVTSDRGRMSVAIGDFLSDDDDRAPEREREETKRLLYVAVTRARDRLYFSSPLKEGRFAPSRGSLGDVLPASFARLLEPRTHGGVPTITWTGASGRPHTIAVQPAGDILAATQAAGQAISVSGSPGARRDGFEPLVANGVPRLAVTDLVTMDVAGGTVQTLPPRVRTSLEAPTDDQALVGSLVHRVFQFVVTGTVPDRASIAERAASLLAADAYAAAGPSAPEDLCQSAVDIVVQLCDEPRMARLLREGRWLREVPFSLAAEPAVADGDGRASQPPMLISGVIDALVEIDEAITVVELKTGQPRPEHGRQLDRYVTAAKTLFPGRPVEGWLLYI